MKQFAIVLAFFPLLAFCIAGVFEWRASKSAAGKAARLVPILLGIAAFTLALHPQWLFKLTPETSVTLSRVMTMFSAVIASSGAFIVYSKRASSVWIACGGLVLAFFWMFNRIVV